MKGVASIRAPTEQWRNSGFCKVGTNKRTIEKKIGDHQATSVYFFLQGLKRRSFPYYADSGRLESPVFRKN